LNAIIASTSQDAFAVNTPEGRCASAEFFSPDPRVSDIARCAVNAQMPFVR